MLAIARRQKYEEALERKRAKAHEKRRRAWEADRQQQIDALTSTYKQSLGQIGIAHRHAQYQAQTQAAEEARKQAHRAHLRLQEQARHEVALSKEREQRADHPFFVAKAQGKHRFTVRQNVSDSERSRARRRAETQDHLRQEDLATQRALEAAAEKSLRKRDITIDITAQVPQSAPSIQDFASTRFHASLTQHASRRNSTASETSSVDSDGTESRGSASCQLGFKRAERLNQKIAKRQQAEQEEKALAEERATARGESAMYKLRMLRDYQEVEQNLAALRQEEINANKQNTMQTLRRLRASWQARDKLDKHKAMLQQRAFEQTFVDVPNEPQGVLRQPPEVLHVIPESEEDVQESDFTQAQAGEDILVQEDPGCDEGERLVHHDVGPISITVTSAEHTGKEDNSGSRTMPGKPPASPQPHISIPTAQSDFEDQKYLSLSGEGADNTVSTRHGKSGVSVKKQHPSKPQQLHADFQDSIDDQNGSSEKEKEIDSETRALLEASRRARQRGNQSVQAILKMGQSFLEGSSDFESADTKTHLSHPRRANSDESSQIDSSATVSSTDISLHARAAAAASAAARAAADAANHHAHSQTTSFPSREQLEQSITHYLYGSDSEIEEFDGDFSHTEPSTQQVGLNASFVSTSSSRSWEPRRTPGERARALNDLALSVLRDLDPTHPRTNVKSNLSVASSDVASLEQLPLSPSSRPSTASGVRRQERPFDYNTYHAQDHSLESSETETSTSTPTSSAVEHLIVRDESWKESDAFTQWLNHVENALTATEEGLKGSEQAKASSSHLQETHSNANSRSQTQEDVVTNELIVEDEGWKTDAKFASFTADLAQYFQGSGASLSSQGNKERQQSGPSSSASTHNEDLKSASLRDVVSQQVFASLPARRSLHSNNFTLDEQSNLQTKDNTDEITAATPLTKNLARVMQTPSIDAKFDALDARLRSAARAAQSDNTQGKVTPGPAYHLSAASTPSSEGTPPSPERIFSDAASLGATGASAAATPLSKSLAKALQTPSIDAKFDALNARLRSAAKVALSSQDGDGNVEQDASELIFEHHHHFVDSISEEDVLSQQAAVDDDAHESHIQQSDAIYDHTLAGEEDNGLRMKNRKENIRLKTFQDNGEDISNHSNSSSEAAMLLSIDVHSPGHQTNEGQDSSNSHSSSIDSLDKVQRALQLAREELRATSRESPGDMIFGSLLDQSSDQNFKLGVFTSPGAHESPAKKLDGSDQVITFQSNIFGSSVSDELSDNGRHYLDQSANTSPSVLRGIDEDMSIQANESAEDILNQQHGTTNQPQPENHGGSVYGSTTQHSTKNAGQEEDMEDDTLDIWLQAATQKDKPPSPEAFRVDWPIEDEHPTSHNSQVKVSSVDEESDPHSTTRLHVQLDEVHADSRHSSTQEATRNDPSNALVVGTAGSSPDDSGTPSPQAFTVDWANSDNDERLVRLPRSPKRSQLMREHREKVGPPPLVLQGEHQSHSGSVAFEVDFIERPGESQAEARSRAFQERSARRAAEAQERAHEREAARLYGSGGTAKSHRRRTSSQSQSSVGARERLGSQDSGAGPARASFGQKVPVDPREQRERTERLFRKLPEVQQKKQEAAERRQAEERRRRVKQMEEERRKSLFRQR